MAQVDDALRDSLHRLVPDRHEEPEWDDILQRLDARAIEQPVTPRRRFAPLTWLMPAAALLATVMVVILATLSSWGDSPSVVAKAEAAIAPAVVGEILYEHVEFKPGVAPVCFAGRALGRCIAPSVRIRLSVEGGTGTRHFRSVTRVVMPFRVRHRLAGTPAGSQPFGDAITRQAGRTIVTEIGGILGPTHVKEALVFQPPNTLVRYTQAPTAIPSDSFDPITFVRHALATGHAHLAGTTTIDHHNVRIIQARVTGVDGYTGNATYYIDRNTYAPFQIVYHHADWLKFPYLPVFDKSARGALTVRFLAFRRIAATPARQAQTDITKVHKGARIICGVEFGLPDC